MRVIILVTLIAKVVTLVQHPKVLDLADGVTSIRFYQLTGLAIVSEFALLVLISSRLNVMAKSLAVLYFSLITGAYRIVAYMADQTWCPCLGSFGTWARLNQQQVSRLLDLVVLYLFVGGLTSIILLFKSLRAAVRIEVGHNL
jgi:hypothetical protein